MSTVARVGGEVAVVAMGVAMVVAMVAVRVAERVAGSEAGWECMQRGLLRTRATPPRARAAGARALPPSLSRSTRMSGMPSRMMPFELAAVEPSLITLGAVLLVKEPPPSLIAKWMSVVEVS